MELRGLEELEAALKPNVTMDDVKRIVLTNGNRLAQTMKRGTTSAYVKGYSTGDTASSINVERRDQGFTVGVGSTMNYTPYVEFGTRYMSAEPVIAPAIQKIYPQFLRDLGKVVDR